MAAEAGKSGTASENPLAIYEGYIWAPWMRHPGIEDEGFYTYREFALSGLRIVEEDGVYPCGADGDCRASV